VPLTIDEFINLSKQYASSLNKIHLFPSGAPTYDWFYSFLNRHHNLILKKSYPLEKKRAALTWKQVEDWFQLLKKILEENDLENRPAQIFNADEAGKHRFFIRLMNFSILRSYYRHVRQYQLF
jgi:hypothetical protein